MDDDNRWPPKDPARVPRRRKPSELYRAFRRWLATDPIEPPTPEPFPVDLHTFFPRGEPSDGGGYDPGGYQGGGFSDGGGGHHH